MKQIFQVGGMRCASCQAHVAKAVKALPGVEHADVNLITGRMTVEHSGGSDFAQTVVQAVKSAGFTAELVEEAPAPVVATVKSLFQVGGMRCASCQAHVAKAVKALPGMFFLGVRKGREDFIYTLTNCPDKSFEEIFELFKKDREQETE